MGEAQSRPLYERDFYLWTQDQAKRLRALRGDNRLDVAHLAEEVEDLGRSELNKVFHHLVQLVAHLLEYTHVGRADPHRHWRSEIRNHQRQARKAFTPGMRQHLDADEIWAEAVRLANDKLLDFGDPTLPPSIPRAFDLTDLLAEAFDIDAAREACRRAIAAAGTEERRER